MFILIGLEPKGQSFAKCSQRKWWISKWASVFIWLLVAQVVTGCAEVRQPHHSQGCTETRRGLILRCIGPRSYLHFTWNRARRKEGSRWVSCKGLPRPLLGALLRHSELTSAKDILAAESWSLPMLLTMEPWCVATFQVTMPASPKWDRLGALHSWPIPTTTRTWWEM